MKIAFSLAALVLLSLLTACAGTTKQPEERDANGNKIEYVYITPTGSSIPIKVRKDQTKTSSKDTDEAEKVLRELQFTGVKSPNGNGQP